MFKNSVHEIVLYYLIKQINSYMLLCGNNGLKQKTVHSSIACCVHVGLYTKQETDVYVLTLYSFRNWAKISNDSSFYMPLWYTLKKMCLTEIFVCIKNCSFFIVEMLKICNNKTFTFLKASWC